MDTTDVLLLYFGACCLGAALIAMMCERAPVMDWQDEPLDLDAARTALPPTPEPAKKAAVLPSRLGLRIRRDPETGALRQLPRATRNSTTGVVTLRRSGLELFHPAEAETDAAAATLIAALWRQPSTIPDEEDGA